MLSQAVANIKVMYVLLLMLFVDKFVKLVGKSVDFSKKIFRRFAPVHIFLDPKKVFYPLGFRFAKTLSAPERFLDREL